MPKKRCSRTGIAAAAILGLLFVFVCAVLIAENLPKTPFGTLSPANDPTDTAATTGTTTYYDRFYPPTEPSEWLSTADTMNWNDVFTFTVKEVTVSKTLPEGCELEDFSNINRVPQSEEEVELAPELFSIKGDENGTLTSHHIYVDLTLHAACIGLDPDEQLGLKQDGVVNYGTAGNAGIAFYDCRSSRIIKDTEVQSIPAFSKEQYMEYFPGSGAYTLEVGDTVWTRLVFIVEETYWNDEDYAVLLTPMCGRYNVEQLTFLGFDQPNFRLDED